MFAFSHQLSVTLVVARRLDHFVGVVGVTCDVAFLDRFHLGEIEDHRSVPVIRSVDRPTPLLSLLLSGTKITTGGSDNMRLSVGFAFGRWLVSTRFSCSLASYAPLVYCFPPSAKRMLSRMLSKAIMNADFDEQHLLARADVGTVMAARSNWFN